MLLFLGAEALEIQTCILVGTDRKNMSAIFSDVSWSVRTAFLYF